MEYKRSVSRSAERTRMAKFRFLNENNNTTTPNGLMARGSTARRSLPLISKTNMEPEIDLSIPGTPVSSRYVIALRERQTAAKENESATSLLEDENTAPNSDENPFTVFLNSMNKLNAGNLKNRESEDLLGKFIKMENSIKDEPSRVAQLDTKFGYNNLGVYNGGSNLRIYPAVQRSYGRRHSLQTNNNENSDLFHNKVTDTNDNTNHNGYAFSAWNQRERPTSTKSAYHQQLQDERTLRFKAIRERFEFKK